MPICPALIDYSMAARTYRYFTKPVLYPFGHGLSYSTFEYSGLSAPARASTGDDVKVSVTVKNTSSIDGDEVAQCYLNRDVAAIDSRTLSAGFARGRMNKRRSSPRRARRWWDSLACR